MRLSISSSRSGKLNILIISPQYRPIVGGYERAAERLSHALAARGHGVTVVAERRERAWPAHEHDSGVEVRRLWCLYRPKLHIATSLASLTGFLIAHGRRFDVWHIQQYGIHAAVAATLAKVLGRPAVLRTTSTGQGSIEKAISEIPFPSLAKRAMLDVNAVVALTGEIEAEVLKFGARPERVHVIGNGVDTTTFAPKSMAEKASLRQRLGINADGVVVFLGRLSPAKNLPMLLRAWAESAPQLTGTWKLVLIGDGPLRMDLDESVKSLGLSTSVVFAGMQSNTHEWLSAADLYVQSSDREGMSNATLEAMASGLPVVSTDVSGSKVLIGVTSAGMVVPVGDERRLCDAIVQLTSDAALRRQMGAAGRRTIEEGYSIESVALRHERLYVQLIRESGTGQ